MRSIIKRWRYLNGAGLHFSYISPVVSIKYYHNLPILDFYKKTTGESISDDYLTILKKKHPNIDKVTHDRLQCTLQILQKFGITPEEACRNLHVFSMNPITMDKYGEILRECGFIRISAKHIIKYHTLVRSRTIAELKKEGLLPTDFEMEQAILDKFQEWPASSKTLLNFSDVDTSILTIRMSVLERFLQWKLTVTPEEFQKHWKTYLLLKHKPVSDIQETLNIVYNDIKFDTASIRRNAFVISADPLYTRRLLENVGTLAGMDIREALKIEPAILKNNYNSVIQIQDILEEYRISLEAQKRCLKVYCMRPETVRERLEELRNSKEYQVLSTHPRILLLVVYKNKMLSRLTKMESAKKQCYTLSHFVSSTKAFNKTLNRFGDKGCGRDIAILISSSLHNVAPRTAGGRAALVGTVASRLRRHKYRLHVPMNVVYENIHFLKKKFDDQVVFNNCLILLYPVSEVKSYIDSLLSMRRGQDTDEQLKEELNYNVNFTSLTDDQILSLVLYTIEKKYHFSGDGIWARQDGVKVATASN